MLSKHANLATNVKDRKEDLRGQTDFKKVKKHPPRGVPRKRCSENMQQKYRRTPMPKRNFSSAK